MILNFTHTIAYILKHPLNKGRALSTLCRFIKWQIVSRLCGGDIEFSWVNDVRMLAKSGETGVTGNIYCGLHEFADMAFLLHLLRSNDTFVDIGANIGSYTVLASAAAGSKTVSFEPVPTSYQRLISNISLNKVEHQVKAHNMALGNKSGSLDFSVDQDCMNHVLSPNEGRSHRSIKVDVVTLDSYLDQPPLLLKIDVEGYELPVLQGAVETLKVQELCAVIIELNGSGDRYGYSDESLVTLMSENGFSPFSYEPFGRTLVALNNKNVTSGNTLFLRNVERVKLRLESAPLIKIHGKSF